MDKLLKKYFGYDHFKEPQEKIIKEVLMGHDVIGLLPTGYGKSITFQIPALLLEGITIVITPLIALMEDQVGALKKKEIPAEFLNSSQTELEQAAIYQLIQKNKLKLLYVSPERLLNRKFKEMIFKIQISLVVIDEAHTILWAEDFRKAYANIRDFIENITPAPKKMALTATAPPLTVKKIVHYLGFQNPKIIEAAVDRTNLFYKVVVTKNKLAKLISYIKNKKNVKGIIYCLTRLETEKLSRILKSKGIDNRIYHGGLDSKLKSQHYQEFKDGLCTLMICTNAFGMGIDIPDIRYVINYELPQSIEDLVQQMGRASRDGAYGEGIVFFDFKDIKTIRYFIQRMEDKTVRKEQTKKLSLMMEYCLSKQCRHQLISRYFGQKIKKCKCTCDNCKKWSR